VDAGEQSLRLVVPARRGAHLRRRVTVRGRCAGPGLTGLPPTFISTATLDLFLEEDLDYARRLLRAGVPVELHVYPGAYQGYDFFTTAEVGVESRRVMMRYLRRALHGDAVR
jgi:acetyl esterase/lipase